MDDNVSKIHALIHALLDEIEGCATALVSTQTNQEVKKRIFLEIQSKIKEAKENLPKI